MAIIGKSKKNTIYLITPPQIYNLLFIENARWLSLRSGIEGSSIFLNSKVEQFIWQKLSVDFLDYCYSFPPKRYSWSPMIVEVCPQRLRGWMVSFLKLTHLLFSKVSIYLINYRQARIAYIIRSNRILQNYITIQTHFTIDLLNPFQQQQISTRPK